MMWLLLSAVTVPGELRGSDGPLIICPAAPQSPLPWPLWVSVHHRAGCLPWPSEAEGGLGRAAVVSQWVTEQQLCSCPLCPPPCARGGRSIH